MPLVLCTDIPVISLFHRHRDKPLSITLRTEKTHNYSPITNRFIQVIISCSMQLFSQQINCPFLLPANSFLIASFHASSLLLSRNQSGKQILLCYNSQNLSFPLNKHSRPVLEYRCYNRNRSFKLNNRH